ncbi:hypothetical protein [Cellulosimicrobium marinum]|uniref:hypothetical protein n=1 Tax=Cellulosimicrobium marinum TaxID=1638992 RepID=UPI001E5DFB08|nr:hypothetical protein [Cellulosimicrobium marinum]MCB7137314.1 hypothetical protein [Cellulosimicrobium marinum]
MTVVADPAGPQATDRAALARAALRRAEERAGVRRHDLRAPLATVPGQAPGRSVPQPPPTTPRHRTLPPASGADERSWPVPGPLTALLPTGTIRRGTVLTVRGSTSLLLALVAGASTAGAWTTAVGLPDVGLLAAADAGVDLGRLALVPRPGPDAALAVAALVDGMDVVVVGPAADLTDTDRRRVLARARERGTVLVAATAWPGAHVALTVTGGAWTGADHGAGWLRRRTLQVERAGRAGAPRPARVEVELPFAHRDWPAHLVEQDAAAPAAPEHPGTDRLRLVG